MSIEKEEAYSDDEVESDDMGEESDFDDEVEERPIRVNPNSAEIQQSYELLRELDRDPEKRIFGTGLLDALQTAQDYPRQPSEAKPRFPWLKTDNEQEDIIQEELEHVLETFAKVIDLGEEALALTILTCSSS